MALFTSLTEVADVLCGHLVERTGIDDVHAGLPNSGTAPTEAVRISFLYCTPQPFHRNDPYELHADGTMVPPPLSLSCFYLVSTSGSTQLGEPLPALDALGKVMSALHNTTLDLPLAAPAPAEGDGPLHVIQQVVSLDQVDKLWSPFQLKLTPWALYEVAPVQLVSPLPTRIGPPAVAPGGVNVGAAVGASPTLRRVSPERTRQGGRIRMEAAGLAALEAITVGGIEVLPTSNAVDDHLASEAAILLTLDHDGLELLGPGRYPCTLRVGGTWSAPTWVTIDGATAPIVDAPVPLKHARTSDLTLTGANLSRAEVAVLWPDAGVRVPTDVHEVPLAGVTATSVELRAAGGLSAVPVGPGPLRLSLRLAGGTYTPWVLVELTP